MRLESGPAVGLICKCGLLSSDHRGGHSFFMVVGFVVLVSVVAEKRETFEWRSVSLAHYRQCFHLVKTGP